MYKASAILLLSCDEELIISLYTCTGKYSSKVPQGLAPPHSQHDPFQIVQHNGQELQLSQGIAAQLQQLPPMPEPVRLCRHGTTVQVVSCHL